jgi:hypothetical protein
MQLAQWEREKAAADRAAAEAAEANGTAEAQEMKAKALTTAKKKFEPYNAHVFHNKRIVVEALEGALASHRASQAASRAGSRAGSRPASASPVRSPRVRIDVDVEAALAGGGGGVGGEEEAKTPKKEYLRKLSRKDVRLSRKSTGSYV